jgi:hypothetical protein
MKGQASKPMPKKKKAPNPLSDEFIQDLAAKWAASEPLPLPKFDVEQYRADQDWTEYINQIREFGPDSGRHLLKLEEDGDDGEDEPQR